VMLLSLMWERLINWQIFLRNLWMKLDLLLWEDNLVFWILKTWIDARVTYSCI
jgi:hypothetical protein